MSVFLLMDVAGFQFVCFVWAVRNTPLSLCGHVLPFLLGKYGGVAMPSVSYMLKSQEFASPGWVAQRVEVVSHTPKDCGFGSQLGHILRLCGFDSSVAVHI